MGRLLLIFALLVAATAHGQLLEISGGDSSLMQGAGGAVKAYLPGSTITAGAGIVDGHFAVGFSDEFDWRKSHVTAGDSSFGYAVENVGGAGIQVRGLSIQRQQGNQSFAAFAGSTGVAYSLPFFNTGTNQHAGAGLFYRRKVRRLELSSLAAFDGGKRTGLASAAYQGRWFRFAGGGGYLAGQKTATGLLDITPVHALHFVAMRQDLFWQNQRATINSASAFASIGRFNLNATTLVGRSAGRNVAGQSLGASIRFGVVAVQSNFFQSNGQKMYTQGVSETFRHWRFSQSLSGTRNISFGGGYQNNRFSVSLDHAVAFLPFAGRQFTQVTQVSFSIRLRDTRIALQTMLLPTGPAYTASADSFVRGPLDIQGTQAAQRSHGHSAGRFLIRGVVLDKSGMPVSGAAVQLGAATVYSDTRGRFMARVRKAAPVALAVLPEQFTADGTWRVVSAPNCAAPDSEVTIQIERK